VTAGSPGQPSQLVAFTATFSWRKAALFRGLNRSGFGKSRPDRLALESGSVRQPYNSSADASKTRGASAHATMGLQRLAHDPGKWEASFPSGRARSVRPQVFKERHWILIRFNLIPIRIQGAMNLGRCNGLALSPSSLRNGLAVIGEGAGEASLEEDERPWLSPFEGRAAHGHLQAPFRPGWNARKKPWPHGAKAIRSRG
jgi:hypothetical protein